MKISSLQKKVKAQRARRVRKVRLPLLAHRERPRLSVYRSARHIYAQIIDDSARKTLVASSDLKLASSMNKTERARKVGEELAKKALKHTISTVVFDRGWYKFHGRVRALAEAARENGLKF